MFNPGRLNLLVCLKKDEWCCPRGKVTVVVPWNGLEAVTPQVSEHTLHPNLWQCCLWTKPHKACPALSCKHICSNKPELQGWFALKIGLKWMDARQIQRERMAMFLWNWGRISHTDSSSCFIYLATLHLANAVSECSSAQVEVLCSNSSWSRGHTVNPIVLETGYFVILLLYWILGCLENK